MAVLNLTPDSFFDGGVLLDPRAAHAAGRCALEHGADLLDLGAESTRPGAQPVPGEEQLRRLLPALEAIRADPALRGIPITIDTTIAAVAAACFEAGADAVNDVSAGRGDPGMFPLLARHSRGVVLMHRLVEPRDDRYSDRYAEPPSYADLVAEVRAFLAERQSAALAAGIGPDQVLLDPGLGFGKSVEQNLELIRATPRLRDLGAPILSALSRKSFVGRVSLGRDSQPSERLGGTLALSVCHYLAGASIFRVHDVREHAEALAAAHAAR